MRSRCLFVVILITVIAFVVPILSAKTTGSTRYAYHPPFGTIHTQAVVDQNKNKYVDVVDPLGAFKVGGAYALGIGLYACVLLIPLLIIRGLLRVSGKSTHQIVIFATNVVISLLTIFLILSVVLVFLICWSYITSLF